MREVASATAWAWLGMFGLAGLTACGGAAEPSGADVGVVAGADVPSEASGADASSPGVASRCVTASDCADAGAVCTCEGLCEVPAGAACTEDRNCGTPRYCNACTGYCEAQARLCEPCEAENGCVDGGACLPFASGGSFCGAPCLADAGCPRGFRCAEVAGVAARQCVPTAGRCADVALCEADADCPLGRICQSQTGQCTAGCVDGGCPNGDVCVTGRCKPPCGSDADCTAPEVCGDGGKCRVPGSCEVRSDCPAPETYCDRETGRCADGCQEDLDCQDAAKMCRDGRCVAKGCTANYQCAFGQVCDAAGACVPYPASEPHCASCDAASGGGPTCGEPNLCVTFQGDDGQPLGDHCLVPCKDDPDHACPSGWQCRRFDDPEGGAARFFCARPCYVAPLGTP